MPRLVGKQSNRSLYLGVTLLVVLAGAGALEYFGATDVVPGFGLESQPADSSNVPVR
jgi:hypothetical protein